MNTKEAIRNNLVRLMKEKGVKNVELARAVGVSKSAVTNWINGTNSIDMDIVPKICRFFEVSVDEFLDVGSSFVLSPTERKLIDNYRNMSPKFQYLIVDMAQTYAEDE